MCESSLSDTCPMPAVLRGATTTNRIAAATETNCGLRPALYGMQRPIPGVEASEGIARPCHAEDVYWESSGPDVRVALAL